MNTLSRLRYVTLQAGLLLASQAAWAHEEHAEPTAAEVAAYSRGLSFLGVVVLVAVGVAVWFHLRKRAILRDAEKRSRE